MDKAEEREPQWTAKESTGVPCAIVTKAQWDQAIREAEQRGAEQEREACARQLEGFATEKGDDYAAAIRARGKP